MSNILPPFTAQSAHAKVKAAQSLWNTRDPSAIIPAYTPDTIWRNRSEFLHGHAAIHAFLTRKFAREQSYVLRKELFAWGPDRIAVQFWYEYWDVEESAGGAASGNLVEGEVGEGEKVWKRCYGLEDWTFAEDGRMRKRMMSGNDVRLEEGERWFRGGVERVDEVEIGEEHW